MADPARPDVPLWIEFTAVFREEKVAVGTVIKAEDKALVPWLFMCNSSLVGEGGVRRVHQSAFGLPLL